MITLESRTTYADETYSRYLYYSDGSLGAAFSSNGSGLYFTYTDTANGKRVWMVEELKNESSVGQIITFDRSRYNTTLMRKKSAVFLTGYAA